MNLECANLDKPKNMIQNAGLSHGITLISDVALAVETNMDKSFQSKLEHALIGRLCAIWCETLEFKTQTRRHGSLYFVIFQLFQSPTHGHPANTIGWLSLL